MVSNWNPLSNPYPVVRRDEAFIETFKSLKNGEVKIPDPYHYLSEPPAASTETKSFVEEQGNYTREYLKSNQVNSDKFKTRLTENWDYSKFSCPALKGDDNYYFTYNSGLQAQSSIYRFHKSKVNDPIKENTPGGELFFDPNLLSEDGSVSRSSSAFSEDGKYFAYSLSVSGSDWNKIYVRPTSVPHIPTQTVGLDEGRLPDILGFVKFSSISWTKDSKGFFYQRFPNRSTHTTDAEIIGTEIEGDQGAMIYYHKINTSQDEDILVMKDDQNPGWMFGADVTDDSKYLILSSSKDTGRSNLLWIASLEENGIPVEISEKTLKWNKVVNTWGEYYSPIANDGTKFYFYTNANDSPNYKISTYDLAKPEAVSLIHFLLVSNFSLT